MSSVLENILIPAMTPSCTQEDMLTLRPMKHEIRILAKVMLSGGWCLPLEPTNQSRVELLWSRAISQLSDLKGNI